MAGIGFTVGMSGFAGGGTLEMALQQATVALTVRTAGATKYGTGFFVAPSAVLTCAHVVLAPDNEPVRVVEGLWNGEQLQLSTASEDVRPFAGGQGPDLALLRVAPPGPSYPAVCLAAPCDPGDELWAFGYPKTDYRGGDPLAFRYVGGGRHLGGAVLDKVAGGQVFPGHSGAPVLNRRTGCVAGVIRARQRPQAGAGEEYGARLIPTSVVLGAFPELAEARDRAVSENWGWLSLLDDKQIRAGGWCAPGPCLRAYLRAARESADEHPYAAALPAVGELSAVYLQQRIAHGPEASSPPSSVSWSSEDDASRRSMMMMRKHVRLLFAGYKTDRQRQSTEPADSIDEPEMLETEGGRHGVEGGTTESVWTPVTVDGLPELAPHALVLGGPGAGKSSLLRHMTTRLAASWLDHRTGAAVPVRVPAEALSKSTSLSEALRAAASADLGTRLRAPLPTDLFQLPPVPGVPWLVLVDGLDEVLNRGDRRRVVQAVMAADPQRYRFVLTSRPLDEVETLPLRRKAPTYWLQTFDPSELRVLATRWFEAMNLSDAESLAERFLVELDRGRLRDAARVPLLATMACLLFGQSGDCRLPRSRADLYEQFTELLLDVQRERVDLYRHLPAYVRRQAGTRGQEAAEQLISGLRGLVEEIAHRRIEDDDRPLLDVAVAATEALRPPGVPVGQWREVLRELLRQSGVLVERFGVFSFVHETFAEYLAACRYCREIPPDKETLSLAALPDMESFALFTAGVWAREGHNLESLVLALLAHDTPMAREVAAALVIDGVPLSTGVINSVTEALVHSATDPDVHHADQRLAILYLTELDRRRGAALIVGLAEDERFGSWAARWLVDVDREQGIELLRRMAGPDTPHDDRIHAARRLQDVDAHLGEEALTALASDDSASPRTRSLAAAALARTAPEQSTAFLLSLAGDRTVEPGERITAAMELAEVAPEEAKDALLTLTNDEDFSTSDRIRAAEELHSVDPERSATLLRAFATDPSALPTDRADAAGSLLMRGHEEQGVALLAELASNPAIEPEGRERGLMWLMELTRGKAAELLAAWSSDPSRPVEARIEAAERLMDLGSPLGTTHLQAMASDPRLTSRERRRVRRALSRLRH
ncbi:trypsin-like peptidase domain-containing protein [Streptomyces sp. NPDC002676]